MALDLVEGGAGDHAVVGSPHEHGGEIDLVGVGDSVGCFEHVLGEGEYELEAFWVLDGLQILLDFVCVHAGAAPLDGFINADADAACAESCQGNGQVFDEVGSPAGDVEA